MNGKYNKTHNYSLIFLFACRLEFLGDAVLDFLVTRYIFVHYNGKLTPGE